jgi:hypothetical protein
MKKVLLVLTILASALTGAQAGIILSDNFNYNNGPVAQPTAASINPSSPWLANSGSGTGKELDVTNNTLIVTQARSEDGIALFQGQPYATNSGVVLYASFTLNCQTLPAQSGTYCACFAGTNVYNTFDGYGSGGANISGFRARVFLSITNYPAPYGGPASFAPGQFSIGIVNSGYTSSDTTIGSTNAIWPTALNTNTSYTIVTRYVLATGASTLWINPTYETDSSVSDPTLPLVAEPQSGWPTNGVLNISGFEFRQNNAEGAVLINSLKVGTHFTDVAGPHTPPTVSTPGNQNTPRNTPIGPLAFTVQSAWETANLLTVTATSSNTGLVPNANISLGSDAGGTNRTVTITPATGQQGFTTISLVAYDTFNYTTNTFLLTVGAPSIGAIGNQIIASPSTATPAIPFAVADTEGDALTLTATSSNPTLVPTSGIKLGVAVAGSSSNVVVTPTAGQTGAAYITISVTDTHNTNSTSFYVTVTPAPLGQIYYENFAYTSFAVPNSLYLASGGTGGPWNEIVDDDSGSIQVTNGLAYLYYNEEESLGAAFATAGTYDGSQGYVFYTSFTVNCSMLPTYFGSYFFHLSSSPTDNTNYRDKIFDNVENAAANMFRLGIANEAGGEIAQHPRDLMTNATYAVVTRYNAATGDSTLWINPVNELSSGVTASDNPGSATIGGVGLREPGDYYIGDLALGPIKVGTAFSDVWTAPARPQLASQIVGSSITLSWTDSSGLFVLQTATNPAGPYTDIQNFTNPYTTAISGQQYFRLRY